MELYSNYRTQNINNHTQNPSKKNLNRPIISNVLAHQKLKAMFDREVCYV